MKDKLIIVNVNNIDAYFVEIRKGSYLPEISLRNRICCLFKKTFR